MSVPHQQNLFELEPLPAWEADDARQQLVAGVIFPTGPDKLFEYATPDHLREGVAPGRRVRVPFGRGERSTVGWCVSLENRVQTRRQLKPLAEVLDAHSLLSSGMLRLTRWMADYYLSTWGQALETVLPAAVRGQVGTKRIREVSLATDALADPHLSGEIGHLPVKQAAVLALLRQRGQPLAAREIMSALDCKLGPIVALQRKGLVNIDWRYRFADGEHESAAVRREPNHALNDDQRRTLAAMLSAIEAGRHETLLIHGVTGSGKTEVYIQAIQEVVRYGRQAIVLVPEISLTPQTVQRFAARFDRVAVLHSHLRDAERHRHWRRIAAGEVNVVVGARSAVFAPTPNLGLIVLDEEHEATFKQEKSPRYHAREVALWRARAENVPLVLGSATPSLESWHRASLGEYRLLEMPRRVLDRPLPDVATIDLRTEFQDRRSRGAVSRQLHQAIDGALKAGGQVILLLNRRGFSTHIQCPRCGYVAKCPHCELPLTHHLRGQTAICHQCDYHTAAPTECPDCHFSGIQYHGFGTQKLEAEVAARFPNARLLRMDADTMQAPDSHDRALAKFRAGEVDILLGTQMIAKGLDFPRVTLVGVVNADTSLHLPDFRAAERTFQLVTQVAGRTGRGEHGGRVLVQTFSPDHPAIRAAVRHDYAMFARDELPIREALEYPPYTRMARVVVTGAEEKRTQAAAHALVDRIKAAFESGIGPAANSAERNRESAIGEADAAAGESATQATAFKLLGPAPAPLPKLRGLLRFHSQVQCVDGQRLRNILRETLRNAERYDGITWSIDIDPFDMM